MKSTFWMLKIYEKQGRVLLKDTHAFRQFGFFVFRLLDYFGDMQEEAILLITNHPIISSSRQSITPSAHLPEITSHNINSVGIEIILVCFTNIPLIITKLSTAES